MEKPSIFYYTYDNEDYTIYGRDFDEAQRNALLETFYRMYGDRPELKKYVNKGKNYLLDDSKRAEALIRVSKKMPSQVLEDSRSLVTTLAAVYESVRKFPSRSFGQGFSDFRLNNFESFDLRYYVEPEKRGFDLEPEKSGFPNPAKPPGFYLAVLESKSNNANNNNVNTHNHNHTHNHEHTHNYDDSEDRSYFLNKRDKALVLAAQSRDRYLIRKYSLEEYKNLHNWYCKAQYLPIAKHLHDYVGDYANIRGYRHVWTARKNKRSGYQGIQYCRALHHVVTMWNTLSYPFFHGYERDDFAE